MAVEKMMNNGSISRDEWKLFTHISTDLHGDEPQESDVQKPHWVSGHVWESVDELELLSVFNCLRNSVAGQSEQWQEYFNVRPHTL